MVAAVTGLVGLALRLDLFLAVCFACGFALLCCLLRFVWVFVVLILYCLFLVVGLLGSLVLVECLMVIL